MKTAGDLPVVIGTIFLLLPCKDTASVTPLREGHVQPQPAYATGRLPGGEVYLEPESHWATCRQARQPQWTAATLVIRPGAAPK